MGKNRVIKTLGGMLGGMVAHKILLKYTNKPESSHHLKSEVDNYGDNALDMAKEYNWNLDDKRRIREEMIKSFKLELKKPHFNDIKFPMNEALKLIEEILKEIIE